jgi:integrase
LSEFLFALHDKAPREAEKARAVLSTAYEVAAGRTKKIKIAEPWIDENMLNPVRKVHLPDRKIVRYLPTNAELAHYYGNLDTIKEPFRTILIVQAQTGARINEVCGARWQDFDPIAKTLTFRATKNGKDHTLPIADATVAALEAWRQHAGEPSPLIFPSPTRLDRGETPERAANALAANRKALGVSSEFTSHCIRRALTTWMGENAFTRGARDRVLNHRKDAGDVEASYNFAEHTEPARDALERWTAHLADLAEAYSGPNVVGIGR